MKVFKINKKHVGYGTWKYFISKDNIFYPVLFSKEFVTWRNWCWDTMGPSREIDLPHDQKTPINDKWCWMSDSIGGRHRIYLKDDMALNQFLLKFL